jgi:hypothetical protein
MATLTRIVTGRVGDALDSDVVSVANEEVTSVFDVWVKFQFGNLAATTVNVEPSGGGAPFTEGAGDDYIIDYKQGLIMVLSTGTMADATPYDCDYDYTDGSLAVKINAITTVAQAAGKAYWFKTAQTGRAGVAVIITEV